MGATGRRTSRGRRRPFGGDSEARRRAGLLRRVREQAGLSQRELASRMGVSWVTVSEAERGRDVRHGTLQAYLQALPELEPSELLESQRPLPPAASPAVWRYYRQLFGFEARALVKDVVVDTAGDVEQRIEVRGVTSARGDLRDERVRGVLQRSVFLGSRAALRELAVGPGDLTTGRSVLQEDDAEHEFSFPERLGTHGFTYVLRQRKAGLFATEALRAAEAGRPGPVVHGTSLAVAYPVRRLRLSVTHAEGRWPSRTAAHAWPRSLVPEEDEPHLLRALHPGEGRLRLDERRRVAVLRVPLPLIELQYGLGWGST